MFTDRHENYQVRSWTDLKIDYFQYSVTPANAGVHLKLWETWIPAGVYPREDGGLNDDRG